MADIVQFARSTGKLDRVETLITDLEDLGLQTAIVRSALNTKGELAFIPLTFVPVAPHRFAETGQIIDELVKHFEGDKAVRLHLYNEFFGVGSLYYEASTSNAVSFEEKEPPKVME